MKVIVLALTLLLLISPVHAGSIDGKGLICHYKDDVNYPWRGFYFDEGKVFELYVKGYAIEQIAGYKYWYKGTKIIGWRRNILDRKTLKLNVDRATCRLSNREGIINFLNQIIYRAKKENKL